MYPKEVYEKLLGVDIADRSGVTDTVARRPYFRMRGKKITEEQAFEVISRSDRYLGFNGNIRDDKKYIYIPTVYFDVNTMWTKIYPRCISMVTPDGRADVNSITDKYPDMKELVSDLFDLI